MNQTLVDMLTSNQRLIWKTNGANYALQIKAATSDSQEADFVIAYAQKKFSKK